MASGAKDTVTDLLEIERSDQGSVLKLKGSWTIAEGVASPGDLMKEQKLTELPPPLKIDASSLSVWDSALIVFLVELKKQCDKSGIEIDASSLPDGAKRLVELALAVPEREGAKRSDRSAGFTEMLGRDVLSALKGGGDMITFLGESFIALGRVVTRRARFRMSDAFLVFQNCGPDALPIVTLISFLIGMILGFVGLIQLQKFGADIFVANLVAIGMIREMGGMMTGIIMAGRTGAAFAAQLGTMNVNDEIAAFRVVGIPPVEFLVLPRMLALIVAVPLLTIYANLVGIIGGSVVAVGISEVTLVQFYDQAAGSADLVDWASGLFKASIYGVIIAIAGCLRGMQCEKSAAAVGDAATSAVVTAIVFIILAQATLTVIYQVLGI